MKNSDVCPLLSEEYQENLREFTEIYEPVLQEKLYEIYDEYFEDDEVQSVLSYFSDEGVQVFGEDFPGVKGSLHLSTNPLRFEFISECSDYRYCIWTMNPDYNQQALVA